MSDENASGTPVPPAAAGAFDWLRESHQASAPMAPLTDDIPAPAPVPFRFDAPDPTTRPAAPTSFPDLLAAPAPVPVRTSFAPPPVAPPPAAPRDVPPPVLAAPAAAAPVLAQPAGPEFAAPEFAAPVLPPVDAPPAALLPPVPEAPTGGFLFSSEPLAPSTFGSGFGSSNLALERRTSAVRSGNGPLDWVAFVLAFLAPPVGLLVGIGAVISGSRTKGYATSIAKAAIGIGAALSLVLGVALVVVAKVDNDRAVHAAIVASSVSWCAKVKSNPATLTSGTFGWPAPGDTIPKSIAAIKTYESTWESIAKVAPSGIRADSQKVADTAKSIEATVQSTLTLDDAGNVAQMQNVVATSGINSWVSNYCG